MNGRRTGLGSSLIAMLGIALLSASALAQTPPKPPPPKGPPPKNAPPMGTELLIANETPGAAYVEIQPSGEFACVERGGTIKWAMEPNTNIKLRMLRAGCAAPQDATCTSRPLNYDPRMKRVLLRGEGKQCGIFPE